MTIPSMQRAVSVVLAVALSLSAGVSVIAAEAEGQPAQDIPPQIRIEPGNALKIGGVKVTDAWLVITDARNDFVHEDGTRSDETNARADIVETWIAVGMVDKRLLKAINGGKLQFGRPGNWRGADFKSKNGDTVVFAVLKTARKATAKTARNQQVVVTFDGDDAFAHRAGPDAGVFTGAETASIGGGFGDSGWLSGDATLKQHIPGEAVALFNAKARGVGGVDKASGSMVHIAPLPKDAQTISVMMRVGAGELYDLTSLPGGGTRIGAPDKPWGFNIVADLTAADPDKAVPPYFCSKVTTTPSGLLEAIFGLYEPLEGPTDLLRLLRLHSALSEEAAVIDAVMETEFGGNVAVVTAQLPEGQWIPDIFNLFDETALARDDQPSPRFSPHFGSAGLLVDADQEGVVSGDERCGRWQLPGTACDLMDHEGIAAAMGIEGEVDKADATAPDGSLLCAAFALDGSDPYAIAGIGTVYYTQEDLERDVASHRCSSVEIDLGATGFLLDCATEGFDSFFWRVLPIESEVQDPDGGLLASVDINTSLVGPNGQIDEPRLMRALEAMNDDTAAMAFRYRLPLGGSF